MYYDAVKDKLFLPAGCYIEKYYCFGFNGQTVEMTLDESFVSERKHIYFNGSEIVNNLLFGMTEYLENFNFVDLDMKQYLFPVDTVFRDTSVPSSVRKFISSFITFEGIPIRSFLELFGAFKDEDDFLYNELLNVVFYANPNLQYSSLIIDNKNHNDLLFGSGKVVSYENERYDSGRTGNLYNCFRKTEIYSPKVTCIQSFKYHERYICNGDNTTNLIPDTYDKSFLHSAFFKHNEDNISGYYIYNDIPETTKTNTVIDYSQPTNYVSKPYSDKYVNNFISYYSGDTNEGDRIENIDNSVVDNSYIDNSVTNYNYYYTYYTSNDDILSKIYLEVYQIRTRLDELKQNIDKTSNNITYNIKNVSRHAFVPNKADVKEITDNLETSAEEHLGILYQPWQFLIYTFGLYSNITEYDDIVLDVPAIDVQTNIGEDYPEYYNLVPETVVNFTNIINENKAFGVAYEIYLTAVDFVVLILLGQLAYRVYHEKKGD